MSGVFMAAMLLMCIISFIRDMCTQSRVPVQPTRR
jgi:hypothetical protein